ncbi:MAG: kinase-like domain-containing protein [Olpidium bornovanus]|uniref:Kinase-like domain-containing protein n=1 Tax=Olpidium bornovanus TaxID=278681 RepID=A0A8H7ZMM5_9FUNG|nr:MAG: kinase-like domain-containing protein [Olpidium bornovanus]
MPRVAAEEGEADGQLLAEAGPPRSPEVWSLSVAPASKDTEAPSEGLPIKDIGLSAGADGASSTFPSIANTPIVPQRDLLVFEDLVIEDVILGSGQFGIVKRGYYRATKERRELTILKKCNHVTRADAALASTFLRCRAPVPQPGIIRLRHAIDSSNMLYLIMDLVNGGDLLEYIMQRGSIVEDEAKFLFHQVCVAVCYLHKRGIVHRDLKPENLLLSMEDGVKRCRIADFGFATLLAGQQQQLHSVIGTPSYMVDTRLNVNGYDQAADLWSLGVILYIMLGGVFPFETDRPIIDQIKAGEFFFPDAQFARVSDSAIDLCCNLLVVDPRRRYSVHQALAHPWLRAESQLDFAR